MKYKCAIFDLDGTLLYTLESIKTALNEVLELCNYPHNHTVEDTATFVNFGSVECVRRALPKNVRSNDEEVLRIHKIYMPILEKHLDTGTKPYDNIVEVCKALKNAGVKLCVMSNKPHIATEKSIGHFFPEDLFDSVRGSIPGKFLKPDATFTNDVISSLGCKNEDCILIGDSAVDIQTAKNALCDVIFVKWGYTKLENLEVSPSFVAETPEDILKIIL